MAVATADDRKQHFIDLLHELFQLDKPELDFGLYRIMHAKSDQLSRFIHEDLAQTIEEAFAEQGEQQLATMRQNIEEKRQQAEEFGAPDPDSTTAVKQARAAYDVAKREQNASVDIYDHLYRFFSRYYDKGDFMSRRHHVAENDSRAAPYAVPYDGREVYLHWANKDQYYVKSSETLANFTFNLNDALKKLHGSAAQGGLSFDSVDAALKVHCRVVDATEGEHSDVKESTERFFLIHHDEPVRLEGADLVLQFEYRPDPEKAGQSGTWQKKKLQEAEEAIMATLRATDGAAAYRDGLATPAPTDKQKSRTLLGKYLQQYTARNTMDYFIHKDLSGFLSRELDFYIKNEILRLDDIDNADVLIVEQQLKKIQVLRKIAKQIITFLAQLENFQKTLWLKKKFVVESNYCITLDHFEGSEELLFAVFNHGPQRRRWEDVFSLDIDQLDIDLESFSIAELVGFEKYRYLMVDTQLLDPSIKEEILSYCSDDSFVDGVIIKSENYQALNFLSSQCSNSFDAVYIDPPYNTDSSEILYKNGYKSSSWVSLIHQGLYSSHKLMKNYGVICATIDDEQQKEMAFLLTDMFSKQNDLGTVTIKINPSGRISKKGLAQAHEYALFFGKGESSSLDKIPRSEAQSQRFNKSDERGVYEQRNFRREGSASERESRPRRFFPIYVCGGDVRIPLLKWNEKNKSYLILDEPRENEEVVFPIDSFGGERVWRWGVDRIEKETEEIYPQVNPRGELQIYYKYRPNDQGVLANTVWTEKEFSATEYGTSILKSLLGERNKFSFPKSLHAVERCLRVMSGCANASYLDYFAGSGTTAHSVIDMNRADAGERKYTLVEMGEHFSSVIKPRLQKVAYSEKWAHGRPLYNKSGRLNGISHCFKYLRLESYDDVLNNLELDDNPQRDALMGQNQELRHDYTLKYMLDVETRGSASLLNTEWFRDPENYTLKIKQPGSDEARETTVDLVETFNWLIGLHVTHLDKPRTYVARFEREKDPELPEDQNTRLKAASLRENEDGAYWIRQVEGHVRRIPGSDEDLAKVLVVWRKLTDDPEKDAAVLEALLEKYKIGTTDSEFDAIYINGSHGLNLSGSARNRVHSLEETFHARMWEGCDDEL